ncbi:MAG: hypothetical protein Q9220_001739 [cf. Caloplaca sp. 1 TL-2023]
MLPLILGTAATALVVLDVGVIVMIRNRAERYIQADLATNALEERNRKQNKPGKSVEFRMTYEMVKDDFSQCGDHWSAAKALGITEFDSYWAYLLGGRGASSQCKQIPNDTPYTLKATPVFNEDDELVQMVATYCYLGEQGKGEVRKEMTFTLPKEQHWKSEKE